MKLLFESWRQYLAEEDNRRNVLILVHPDAVWDHGFKFGSRGVEFMKKYYETLQEETPKFDKVFSLFLYPEGYYENNWFDKEKNPESYEVLMEIKNYLEQETEALAGKNSGKERGRGSIFLLQGLLNLFNGPFCQLWVFLRQVLANAHQGHR